MACADAAAEAVANAPPPASPRFSIAVTTAAAPPASPRIAGATAVGKAPAPEASGTA